jgi:trimeric autotransporter adhesin
MKKFITLLIILSSFLFNLYSQDMSNQNIEKILDKTGLIKPKTVGSFNTKGYKMTYGKNKEPVFSKINSPQESGSYEWGSLGSGHNGTNGFIVSMAVDGNGNIYVGGNFTLVSDVYANNIAKWNGTSWSALSSGSSNGVNSFVTAIAVSGTDVYVGGFFTLLGDGTTSANYIAKWSTSTNTWSTLTSGESNGVNSYVWTIAVSGSNVYVGGYFNQLGDGSTSANYIAKWNGTEWSTLPGGESNGVGDVVQAIAVNGSDVYVGGAFTLLGDGTTSANYIAKWNGTEWSTLPGGESNGVSDAVYAIAVSGSDVYVGGTFTMLGDGTTPANYIARWNGTAWSALTGGESNGVYNPVQTIAVNGTDVYVGGAFTMLGDGTTSANHIAKWNGNTWSALTGGGSDGVGDDVYAIAVSGSDVYVGGFFSYLSDNSTQANYITKWNGTSWSTVMGNGNNGVAGSVYAIAVSGSDVYVGGYFTQLGDNTTSANYIAKWNGTAWSTLTSGASNGVNNSVYAIAVSGSDVYVGGGFTYLGDGTTSANSIAKWNTASNTWSTLTSGSSNGVNEGVFAITVSGNDVYVGGNFTQLGDGTTSANYIARWNTVAGTWSALTSGTFNGVNAYIRAIAISGSDVYVGGVFNRFGDNLTSANSIAKWNGTTWSTLPSGSSDGLFWGVNAIAISGSDVYVGGLFNSLGDHSTSAKCIAKWNTTTSTWSTLTSGESNGVNDEVKTIAISGSDVYVGGNFDRLGDNTTLALRLAKWNGTTWSAVDNGANELVYAMQFNPANNKVYVGGDFNTLNNTGAFSVGFFTDAGAPLPVELSSFTSNASGRDINLFWATKSEKNSNNFDIERSVLNDNAVPSWTSVGSVKASVLSNSTKHYSFTDKNLQSGKYQYRLKMIDNDGSYKYSEVIQSGIGQPASFALTQNYPNPFNPATRIDYQVPVDSRIILEVFSITGQKVAELVNRDQQAGYYSISFGSYSSKLASGVYIYKIAATEKVSGINFSAIKKMILLK